MRRLAPSPLFAGLLLVACTSSPEIAGRIPASACEEAGTPAGLLSRDILERQGARAEDSASRRAACARAVKILRVIPDYSAAEGVDCLSAFDQPRGNPAIRAAGERAKNYLKSFTLHSSDREIQELVEKAPQLREMLCELALVESVDPPERAVPALPVERMAAESEQAFLEKYPDARDMSEERRTAFAEKLGSKDLNPLRLSESEMLAVFNYTNSHYSDFNRALRAGDPTPEIQKEISLLDRALARFPDHRGFVYRNTHLRPATLDAHVLGARVTDPGYVSTARELGDYGGQANFLILTKSGKAIEFYSKIPTEREVLIPRGKSFRVLDRRDPPSEAGAGARTQLLLMEE